MWVAGSIGAQRGPACSGRLRAQWRQVDTENREAIAVRRQWMALLGMSQEEIDHHCSKAVDLSLEEELSELLAAIGLTGGE